MYKQLSIVVPVLNSHEIVRRNILHYKKMDLPDDVEIIYVDDGSEPPLRRMFELCVLPNLVIYETNDKRPWTWALARNLGARMSSGKYMLMTDLDYIIPKATIDFARQFTGQYAGLRRELGILDENGDFTQDREALLAYGLVPERYDAKGTKIPAHTNNFIIRRDIFLEMGGYREDRIGLPYPQGEDNDWRRKRRRMEATGKLTLLEDYLRPVIYMFPNGRWCGDVDFNPFGLFHGLSRKSGKNPFVGNELR